MPRLNAPCLPLATSVPFALNTSTIELPAFSTCSVEPFRRRLTWPFLTTATSYLAGTTGILPNICNTLYLILIAMGAALPLGVGAAVYITEYAENPRIVRLISFAAETLTGIPSILFGLIGMLFFIKLAGLKQGVLAGGLTLALMVLPTVMANTEFLTH